MTIDYAEKERAFLASLAATSGRDLANWMAAIEAEAPPHRNDIIDWLRQQGFPFARASWLERIHDNGGRPLYEGSAEPKARPAPRPPRASSPRREEKTAPAAANVVRLVPRGEARAPSRPAAPAPAPASPALDVLLARAKAYRPLAQHLLREIGKAVPGAAPAPREGYVSIGASAEFGVLAPAPREVRLGLALGSLPFDGRMRKAKFGAGLSVAAAITHMIVLTDAREVDAGLMDLVRQAAQRASGS